MAGAIAIASFLGSVIKSQGEKRSASAAALAYDSRAFQSEMEAADFENMARIERVSTGIEESRLRNIIDRTRGSQRAAVAKSGVELSGSSLDVIEYSAEQQELDALILRYAGESRALARERDAAMARLNASTLRAEGQVVRKSGRASAAGTLLTGGIGALGQYVTLTGGFSNGNNT